MDYVLLREANDFVLHWNNHPDDVTLKEFPYAVNLIDRLYNALYETGVKESIKTPAQAKAKPRYEYQYEAFPFTMGGIKQASNLGKEGWELVGVYDGTMAGHTMSVAKYRREVQP